LVEAKNLTDSSVPYSNCKGSAWLAGYGFAELDFYFIYI